MLGLPKTSKTSFFLFIPPNIYYCSQYTLKKEIKTKDFSWQAPMNKFFLIPYGRHLSNMEIIDQSQAWQS